MSTIYIPGNQDAQGNVLVASGGAGADAFGRSRVSNPFLLFASKQDLASQDYLFNSTTATGGSITYSANRASSSLAVTTSNGSRAVRRSKQHIPYQPGKSLQMICSGVMGSGQTNTTKRVGMFDDNNGLFFELSGTSFRVVKRSFVSGSAVDTATAQASWNIDVMDGTGPSGLTLDLTKVQIFVIDLQWLGAGRVRFGFDIGGKVIYVHEMLAANTLTSVYMTSAYLPVGWEIVNTSAAGATASVEMICCQVSCEGGFDAVGTPFACNNGATAKSVGNANLVPVLQLRTKSGQPRAPVQLKTMELMGTSADNVYWTLLLNATVTGGTAASYNSVHASSYLEFDVAATGVVTGGQALRSGYMSSVTRNELAEITTHLLGLLSADFSGTRDVITLAAQNVSAGSVNLYGSLGWLEFV